MINRKRTFSTFKGPILVIFCTAIGVAAAYIAVLVITASISFRQKAGTHDGWLSAWSWETYIHLTIPIAVLAMEVYVIFKMTLESRERAQTVSEMQALTARSQRREYMLDIAKAVQRTSSEAEFTTATMEVSTKSDSQREILEAVAIREKRGPYRHRGLIAKRRNTMPGALELIIKTKIEVRLCDAVAMSRLRFYTRDRQETILGIAEGPPDLADPKKTTQSTRIDSRMLAESLHDRFEKLWENAVSVGSYLDDLIRDAEAETRAEVISWFCALGMDNDKVDDFLQSQSGSELYPTLPTPPETSFDEEGPNG